MKDLTIEEAAEKFKIEWRIDRPQDFIEGAKWQQEQLDWKYVLNETPPEGVELLVKSPNGIIHLANWRGGYNIFTCQDKKDKSWDWQWKLI